jgi:riboflavin kinase / FMN adenylyltransferase
MRIVSDLSELVPGGRTVLTIGAFDGVHRGHQFLIGQVVDRARCLGYESLVVTFDPRPQVVLRPGEVQLADGEEKARYIAALEPDVVAVLPFTPETAAIPAGAFLAWLREHVNVAEIWVGADFAFGHNREGNVEFLIGAGQTDQFAVHVLPREPLDGIPVSSSLIRKHISEGDVAQATVYLGHYPSVRGRVVAGAGRGRDLGFPTANLETAGNQLLPATGIYAGYLVFEGRKLPAAISVGYNPVFRGEKLVVEAFVLDFDADLRGKEVVLEFAARIREERNFESVEGLVAEMGRDVARVREVLGRGNPEP